MISRFNPPAWIVAVARDTAVSQGLAFSYGVHPVQCTEYPANWVDFSLAWLREHQVEGRVAMLVTGPSPVNAMANHRIEFIRVGK